jgi:hypothetical protein
MAAAPPYDINCGSPNVDCSPPDDIFKTYLVEVINYTVDSLLAVINAYPLQTQQQQVVQMKENMFKFCLHKPNLYTSFENYFSQELATGLRTGELIYNMDYIRSIRSGQIPDLPVKYKILHLFVIGLTIYFTSTRGWIDYKQAIRYLETPNNNLDLFLPINTSVPATLIQVFNSGQISFKSYKEIRSIQALYAIAAYNFFIGGGESISPASISRNPGMNIIYRADTNVVAPPMPFAHNTIIWNNNANQSLSTEIYVSCFDDTNNDIGFLLEDGIVNGQIMIRNRVNHDIVLQEWNITGVAAVQDQYVTYQVTQNSFTQNALHDQVYDIVILKPGQTVPNEADDIRRAALRAARGGRKKRQNKSKRNKQKYSNKKFRFSKRRYSRRRRMF